MLQEFEQVDEDEIEEVKNIQDNQNGSALADPDNYIDDMDDVNSSSMYS